MKRAKAPHRQVRSGAEICHELIAAAAAGYPPDELRLERMLEIFVDHARKDEHQMRRHLLEFGYAFPAYGQRRAVEFVAMHEACDTEELRFSLALAILAEAEAQGSPGLPTLRAALDHDQDEATQFEDHDLDRFLRACRVVLDSLTSDSATAQ